MIARKMIPYGFNQICGTCMPVKKESANLKMLEQKFGSVKCVIVPNVSLIYKI